MVLIGVIQLGSFEHLDLLLLSPSSIESDSKLVLWVGDVRTKFASPSPSIKFENVSKNIIE